MISGSVKKKMRSRAFYLAALACEQTVVVSRHSVSADRTQLLQVIVICVFHNLQRHTWDQNTRVHERRRRALVL